MGIKVIWSDHETGFGEGSTFIYLITIYGFLRTSDYIYSVGVIESFVFLICVAPDGTWASIHMICVGTWAFDKGFVHDLQMAAQELCCQN